MQDAPVGINADGTVAPALAPIDHGSNSLTWPLWPILVGWALGCAKLAEQSLWIDEWATITSVRSPWADVLAHIVQVERRPPLQFVLLKAWSDVVGVDELALRWLSLAWVMLAIALIFVLGRRLLNRSAGLVAAWLLALSPFWLLYGRMLRAYSQTLALTLLTTVVLLYALERRHCWFGYALAVLALIYTDYSGLAVVGAHGLYVLFSRTTRRVFGYWLLSAAAAVAGLLPWATAIVTHLERTVRVTDLSGGIAGVALKLALPFYIWGVGETVMPWHPLGLAGAVAAALLLLWGCASLFRANRGAFWLLAAGVVIPLVFTATLLTFVAKDITFLNAASRSPAGSAFFYLLVAAGVTALLKPLLRWGSLLIVLGGFAVATANYFGGVGFLNPIYAVPTRQIAAQVATNAAASDLIVAEPDTLIEYYVKQHPGNFTYQDVDAAANRAWIEKHRPANVWLLTFGRDSTSDAFSSKVLAAWLDNDYHLVSKQGFAGVDPFYQVVKERLTHHPSYAYKLQLRQYRPNESR